MAGEIQVAALPNRSIYVLVLDPIGRAWNRNSGQFEEVLQTKWVQYAIGTVEEGGETGVYLADMPPAGPAMYGVVAYEMMGAAPAPTDGPIGSPGRLVWDGAREIIPRPPIADPAPSAGGNMIKRGLRWLSDRQREHNSEDVIYRQPDGATIHCRAMLGNKRFRIDTGDGGYRLEQSDLDFLIHRSELPWIEPMRGDLITIDMEGTTQIFEVTPFGGDPPWRYSDPHETMLRIHTKLVQTDPHVVWP
jgi:hypothetical protein